MDNFDRQSDPRSALLRTALAVSVPLYIEEFRQYPWERIQEIAQEAAQVVAEKGDIILFRSEKRGETAKAFNQLARGLAALAFAPGGVKFLGLRFEAYKENTEGGL